MSSFLFLVVLDQFYISRYHFYNFLELLFTMVFNIWKNIFVMNFPFFNGSKCIKCFLSKCPSLLSLSWVSLRKSFIKKALVVAHLFASPVLLTKFGLSVSSIWSPGLIENLTFWPCDFQNISQLAIYSLDFTLAKEPETERKFEVELLYFDILFTNEFYIWKYISILCWIK